MKEIITTIKVMEDGQEVSDTLRNAVLEARAELCDIVNGKGGAIEKYNELTDMLLFDTADDDEYIDIYEKLSNICWTKLLNRKGYPYTVINEVMYQTTNLMYSLTGVHYITKITIAKKQ